MKQRAQYRCTQCEHVMAKWVGRCPECGTWGTVEEAAVLTSLGGRARRAIAPSSAAVPISAIDPDRTPASGTTVAPDRAAISRFRAMNLCLVGAAPGGSSLISRPTSPT